MTDRIAALLDEARGRCPTGHARVVPSRKYEDGTVDGRCLDCGEDGFTIYEPNGGDPEGPPVPPPPHGIYGASRTARAGLWRGLRASGYPIIGSWIDVEEVTDRAALLARAFTEAASAERLIWVIEPGDFPFKIAWGEVCVALHAGVPVWIVALDTVTDEQLGGLPSHPLVKRTRFLSEALAGTRAKP